MCAKLNFVAKFGDLIEERSRRVRGLPLLSWLLNLMGEDERLPVAGRVIWVTPKGAQGKRTAGIGVQFSEQDRGATQRKIEAYLAGAVAGEKATHTM